MVDLIHQQDGHPASTSPRPTINPETTSASQYYNATSNFAYWNSLLSLPKTLWLKVLSLSMKSLFYEVVGIGYEGLHGAGVQGAVQYIYGRLGY